MPWAVISSRSDDKLFYGPKHNIYALFMIIFDLFDFILLFVCQICHVNWETEIKEIYLKKQLQQNVSFPNIDLLHLFRVPSSP